MDVGLGYVAAVKSVEVVAVKVVESTVADVVAVRAVEVVVVVEGLVVVEPLTSQGEPDVRISYEGLPKQYSYSLKEQKSTF